jgi:hypothetical protein
MINKMVLTRIEELSERKKDIEAFLKYSKAGKLRVM